ncbi:LysE family translocator [Deinococcus aestuarii]|uniref:LysE family translocator n=1 Tax=Deinococcus aestuarii TaxID=2774531 RepID=UPI001FEA2701|nr:LysE family translocator [Deinococcus aestuarii]
MLDAHQYGAFLLAALVLAVLPGPGLLYVLARSLGGGRRDGVQSSFGTLVGGMFHVFASAAGLSTLILASSLAFSLVKYAGAAYLIYLGVRTLLSKERLSLDVNGGPRPNHAFRQGVITELLNPKTALFFLAFVPQFVNPEAGGVFWQFVLLGTTSVVLNTLADLLVAAFAGPLGSRLRLNARFQRGQRVASGGAMIALGTYAAVDR